jgi:hypothetical protein
MPDDVGILLGIPLTEERFHERVQFSDWIGMFAEPGIAANYWREVYRPLVVEPVTELIEYARDVGAAFTDATLDTLKSFTASKLVVVLLAHWKDGRIGVDDIDPNAAANDVRDRAAGASSPLARWLERQFAAGRNISEAFADALNVPLAEESTSHDAIVVEGDESRIARRREEIQRLFPNVVKPGNRLEFMDGFHSKEAVEAAVSGDFDGVIDFAACRSTVLADYVAHKRSNRLRTVQAPNPIEFVATAPIIKGTLKLLSSGLFGYQEARAYARGINERAICRT